jgi:septal ring factor EnvC (AmiA/AmiB activator)
VTRIDQNTAEFKRAELLAKIRHLESQQARPMRELTIDTTNDAARERLEALEDQIDELRGQLPENRSAPRRLLAAMGDAMKQDGGSDRAIARGAWVLIGIVLGGALVLAGIIRGAVWIARHVHFG